jgi:outer membrane protein TolC
MSLFPKLQLQAKAGWDYPNGPVLERIQQNTVSASLTMPLFEFWRTRHEAAEKSSLALSMQARMEQTEKDLQRDLYKIRDQLLALKSERDTLTNICDETTQLARLIYSAYQNGRSSFLEVQSANLKALDARVQVARNEVQILVQQAQLKSLISED